MALGAMRKVLCVAFPCGDELGKGNHMFQLAPRSPERGDTAGCPRTAPSLSFNPRPAHVSGATAALPFG